MSAEAATAVGATPSPSEMTRWFLRIFGPVARKRLTRHPQLGIKLAKARNPLVPTAYLASVYGHVALAIIVGSLPLIGVLAAVGSEASPTLLALLVILPGMLAIMTFSYDMLRPDLEISARKRNLDSNLPYALNFMAALASAGVVPVEIFGSLGKQEVYGDVAKEAMWIYRDTKIFSKDLVHAIQDASRRSPSQLWEEFLQGSVNTITSGGDLKTYLLAKSEQYSQEHRRKVKGFLESMGVMAESYVVVAAAAPLFLIVIFSVMMLLSSEGDPVLLLNLLVLLGLPVIHGAFTWILHSMRPD